MNLADQHAREIEKGTPPLSKEQAAELAKQVPLWTLNDKSIVRQYKFADFPAALDFLNRVARVVDTENHHPDMLLSYNRLKLEFSTHSVGGLSANDFILAAKIDRLQA